MNVRRVRIVSAVTLVRIPLGLAFAAAYLCIGGITARVTAGLAILSLIEMSDLVDGRLARRWNSVTEWGASMDPYADSITRLLVFWTLAVAGTAMAIVPLVMAVRDVTVAYCRIAMARQHVTVAANRSGKVKAVVQGTAAFLLVGGPIYQRFTGTWTNVAVSWIVVVVTAVSAVEYVRAAVATLSD